jgi:hypothetical protein
MGRQLTHQLQSLLISQKDIDRHNLDENHVNGKEMGIDRRLLENHEFDVFLSFAPADIEFAGEMKLRLYHRLDSYFMWDVFGKNTLHKILTKTYASHETYYMCVIKTITQCCSL